MCVFVCLSHLRYLEPKIVSPRSLSGLKEFAGLVAQIAFLAYMTHGSKEKALQTFRQ